MEIRRVAIMGALSVAGAALAACGGAESGGYGTAAARPAVPDPVATKVGVAGNAELGKIVVDGTGRALYRFDKDTAKPPSTKCTGACAKTWPPVIWSGDLQVAGVDRALLGKVMRPDGGWQVTLSGWPLYRYAKDASPGEVNGQGMGGTWYVSAPNGTKARTSDTKGGNNDGGNYGGGGDGSGGYAEGFEPGGSGN